MVPLVPLGPFSARTKVEMLISLIPTQCASTTFVFALQLSLMSSKPSSNVGSSSKGKGGTSGGIRGRRSEYLQEAADHCKKDTKHTNPFTIFNQNEECTICDMPHHKHQTNLHVGALCEKPACNKTLRIRCTLCNIQCKSCPCNNPIKLGTNAQPLPSRKHAGSQSSSSGTSKKN